MAGFRTHITVSTMLGTGCAAAGYANQFPLSSCLVAGGLCSLAGMLPDLDSDSGVPVREVAALTAALVPALMIPRFEQLGMDCEQFVLTTAIMYLAVRFGLGGLFKGYTVHRGMWHSLPAAAITGLVTFLLVSGDELPIRLFKSITVMLGFLSHLVLDEVSSVQVRRGRLRIRPLGTALKLWTTHSLWANVSTYGKLAALIALVVGDPYLMQQLGVQPTEIRDSARQWWDQAVERAPPALPWPRSLRIRAGENDALRNRASPSDADADTARMPFGYPAAESPARR
jgi:membrane-bound metal-dependent hydrolase YbcI (DUF457 family)